MNCLSKLREIPIGVDCSKYQGTCVMVVKYTKCVLLCEVLIQVKRLKCVTFSKQ